MARKPSPPHDQARAPGFSRRTFLKTAGAGAAASAVRREAGGEGAGQPARIARGWERPIGPDPGGLRPGPAAPTTPVVTARFAKSTLIIDR